MKISPKGVSIVKQFEGCRLDAYKCPAGIWTIGYGHTGKDVSPGMQIAQTEADRLLAADLVRFEDGVNALGLTLTQGQFDALVSFAFNLGLSSLRKSTLLKKLKAGDVAGAGEEFLKWTKAGGRVLTGLALRRAAERERFLAKETKT